MNKKMVRLSAFALFFTMNVFAQEQVEKLDEVVVSDSKFALSKEKSGKVIVKITAEELAKKSGQSVATVLSSVVGIEINGNQSRNGKDFGIYVRGGRNHQVLILIDGVPVTDASGISMSYDLRLLPVNQIESIEIMKGASSTLYGSGAATAVINITLKKAIKGLGGDAYFNVGTQTIANKANYRPQDYNQGFSFNGKDDKLNFFGAINSTETKGISEAKSADKSIEFEDDSFSRINSIMKLGFTPTKNLALDFSVNYDKTKSDFDSGSFSDDLENNAKSEQYRFGFSPKYKYNKGELVVNTSANTISRDIFSFGDLFKANSRSINTDVFNKYQISSQLFVITGAQFQFHEMSNKSTYSDITKELAKFNMFDPYVSAVYNSKFGLNVNAGTRYNMHSKYGNNAVFNLNPSYNFSKFPLKVLASYSTAFVTPSLYQLYSPYGDLDLSPEKDATVEAGFEVSLFKKKVTLNTVVFHREENDAIGFDLITYKYYNISGKNNLKGLETMVSYAVTSNINVNANYTYTQLERQSSILNPKHKANLSVDVQANTRLAFNLAYQFVYDRYIEYTTYPAPTFDPVLNSEILKDYQLVNANVRYGLIKNKLNLFGAIDNILDKDFVESRGYSTRGRNFKVGLNLQF